MSIFMLQNALQYTGRGWAVFPVDPSTKRPLLKAERDPETGEAVRGTGGLKKASSDSEIVASWWTKWPAAMIGLPTGPALGSFVIDIDAGQDNCSGRRYTYEELI